MTMKENLKNIGLIILSFVILLFLPQGLNTVSYVILGVSVCLFMIGYFRVYNGMDAPDDKKEYRSATVLWLIMGLGIMTFGAAYLCISQASGKGMILSFLFIIEGLILLGTANRGSMNLRMDHGISVVLHVYGICTICAAIIVLITGSMGGAISFVLMMIQGVIVILFGQVSSFRERIEGMNMPISELFYRCKDNNTPLGSPRLAPVGKRKECIVFGPDDSGLFVYCYYRFGRFYVALGDESKETRDIMDTEVFDSIKEMFEEMQKEM